MPRIVEPIAAERLKDKHSHKSCSRCRTRDVKIDLNLLAAPASCVNGATENFVAKTLHQAYELNARAAFASVQAHPKARNHVESARARLEVVLTRDERGSGTLFPFAATGTLFPFAATGTA